MFQMFNPFSRKKKRKTKKRRRTQKSLEELGFDTSLKYENDSDGNDDYLEDTLVLQTQTTSISMSLVEELLQTSENIVLLDVRSIDEYDKGHIPGAINIPNDDLIEMANIKLPDENVRIYVYSQENKRCMRACRILGYLGYSNVTSIGSITNWTGKLEETPHS